MKCGDLVTVHHLFTHLNLLLANRREDGEFVSGTRMFCKSEIGLIIGSEGERFHLFVPEGMGWVLRGFIEVISETR